LEDALQLEHLRVQVLFGLCELAVEFLHFALFVLLADLGVDRCGLCGLLAHQLRDLLEVHVVRLGDPVGDHLEVRVAAADGALVLVLFFFVELDFVQQLLHWVRRPYERRLGGSPGRRGLV